MSNQPNDYSTRRGVLPISWEDFHGLCKALARSAARFQPEVVLPIGRGGFYPGALIAHLLQLEVYPVRVSRRVHDVVRYSNPQWIMRPPELVRGRRVLIVDEICGSGQTILMVKQEAEALGAAQVRSAVLYAHSWGVGPPDYIGLISDALILNPWDREIWKHGEFQFHPEYVSALALQGRAPDASLRIDAAAFALAKSAS